MVTLPWVTFGDAIRYFSYKSASVRIISTAYD